MNWMKRNKEIYLLRGGNFSAQVHLYQNEWLGTLFISGKTYRITPNNCLFEAKQCIEKLITKLTSPNEVTEPDYKALYKELLQGVKDAKAEMNNQFRKKLYADTIILGMAYNNCIEILTDKTGI